ncbi:MAG: fibronectin type III domain-containing protein, partial [Patescibacteria group bacterium]
MKSRITSLTMATLAIIGITVGTSTMGVFAPAQVSAAAAAPADTTPPATPGNFRLENRTGSDLRFNWDWTTDNVGYVTQYEILYAGRTVLVDHYYPGHTQNVADLNLSPGHSYTFSLRAIDQAGNRSLPTQLVFETTPPSRPSNLRLLSTTQQGHPDIISFSAASDRAGAIRGYEVFFNNSSVRMMRGLGPEFS